MGVAVTMAGVDSELTPREQEIALLIADGATNKEAGRRLGISPRTVEIHRAHIMAKLGARNAADLVRIVLSRYGEPRPHANSNSR
jgi:DNA-binding CsgD family transcriptional regulator